jgi:hypothetical protein
MDEFEHGDLVNPYKFKFQPPEVFYSDHRRAYKRRILDLEPAKHKFHYINVLCTDGKKFLLIGTEEGDILVFSLAENKILKLMKADRWINSLLLSKNNIFTVGQNRAITCFNMKGGRRCLSFPQSQDGYGAKGIKLSDTAITNKIIANVGFGKFKIFDAIKLKVIYSFDIAVDTLREVQTDHGTNKPLVINYCVIKKFFKVCYLLEEDGNVYFYNYKQHKLLRKIKLFDVNENLANHILLVNSLLIEQDGFLFIVLQFSKNDRLETKELKTILCVIRIFRIGEHRRIEIIFHSRLCRPTLT